MGVLQVFSVLGLMVTIFSSLHTVCVCVQLLSVGCSMAADVRGNSQMVRFTLEKDIMARIKHRK